MSENFVVSGGNRLNGEKKRIVDTDIIVDTLRGVQASRDYLVTRNIRDFRRVPNLRLEVPY